MPDQSFAQSQEMMQAYNECISSKDPQLKQEACNRYKQMKQVSPNGDMGMAGYAEGGMVDELGPSFMEDPDFMMEDDEIGMDDEGEEMEPSILDLAPDVLDEEEMKILNEILDMHPELPMIIDKLSMAEGSMEGHIEGPGDGTSDSIPAKLSDGEFVFTAKAVKQIGVDKLYKMMKQAEESFDATSMESEVDQEFAMGGFVQRKCK